MFNVFHHVNRSSNPTAVTGVRDCSEVLGVGLILAALEPNLPCYVPHLANYRESVQVYIHIYIYIYLYVYIYVCMYNNPGSSP